MSFDVVVNAVSSLDYSGMTAHGSGCASLKRAYADMAWIKILNRFAHQDHE